MLESRVESLVAAAVEAGQADRLTVRQSRIGADLLIEIERTGHRLDVRVQTGGALLSVDMSEAMEFAEADDQDMRDLEQVLRAYCLGELAVQTGADGTIHALRTSAGQLSLSEPVFGSLRSGHRTWRNIG